MVQCKQCKIQLKGAWKITDKNDEVELGISSGWLLMNNGGHAYVYCHQCFQEAMVWFSQNIRSATLNFKEEMVNVPMRQMLEINNELKKTTDELAQREKDIKKMKEKAASKD